ncbi:hypothetical protein [Aneurinibacillus danicus]|uniref:Uncharacterized protein n=1 Tax=Aneurinibacillus danicus TaxID=267746 RepID=A0A511VDT9_9BACL|nr:hypothetical protein [Aneurinibacillus danicus]GEN36601.1 hypothetical protein ADA01nite_40610 [Aneurinibacillus danicus]
MDKNNLVSRKAVVGEVIQEKPERKKARNLKRDTYTVVKDEDQGGGIMIEVDGQQMFLFHDEYSVVTSLK